MQGMAIMASSGYNWDNDQEILLNTAVIGSPGVVLPRTYNGGAIPNAMKIAIIAHREPASWYFPIPVAPRYRAKNIVRTRANPQVITWEAIMTLAFLAIVRPVVFIH